MRRKLLNILLIVVLALAMGSLPALAGEVAPLLDGLYQPSDGSATAMIAAQPDGSLIMRLWQGNEADHGGGFAYLGRLVPNKGAKTLTGAWQAMPGSCCPGRGRQEIETLGPESFRFTLFAPSLDRTAWQGDPERVFRRVSGPAADEPAQRLAGQWSLTYWYNDLLPGEAPADLSRGLLKLSPVGESLQGVWQEHPGVVTLTLQPGGALLTYRDTQADFELKAQLGEEAGGLSLTGVFTSNLGKGQMTLTRRGLPAIPPGPQISQEGNLSGLWVDQRTGSDFFKITGSDNGFSFMAYGGSLDQPRYLSKGRAQPDGPGLLKGTAQDQPGNCCGNQGQFLFRQLDPKHLEVTAQWWPQGQDKPRHLKSESYVIERTSGEQPATAATASAWPQAISPRVGLPAGASGSLQVQFKPREGSTGPQTLFSQGGYGRRLELYLDPEGHLAVRMDTAQGVVELRSPQKVEPGQGHAAWLIWEAGGQIRLYLDTKEVAAAPLPSPWLASSAPYLVGGSRWPNRVFAGDIDEVRLWAEAQNPDEAAPPGLTITPGAAQPAQETQAQAEAPATHALLRLWHPSLLRHAYVTGPEQAKAWQAKGYRLQGPIARLWVKPVTGSRPLWAFQQTEGNEVIISPKADPAPGYSSLGLLGYAPEQAGPGRVELWGMRADLPDPLRGRGGADRFYATDKKSLEEAHKAGYAKPQSMGPVLPPQGKASFSPPLLYTWSGAWRGEGWGRFYLLRKGGELVMFWYYANMKGPKFYGRYRLAPDGKSAEGVAVGQPGPKARFYRHRLEFELASQAGPRVRLTSWRLAAPLDDGRLVSFTQPRATNTLLIKAAQQMPPREQSIVEGLYSSPDPQALYQQAMSQAKATGRLLER